MKQETNLYLAVPQARNLLTDAVGQIMNKLGIPSVIMDGIICDVLCDVRKNEIHDIEIARVRSGESSEEETDEEPSESE